MPYKAITAVNPLVRPLSHPAPVTNTASGNCISVIIDLDPTTSCFFPAIRARLLMEPGITQLKACFFVSLIIKNRSALLTWFLFFWSMLVIREQEQSMLLPFLAERTAR